MQSLQRTERDCGIIAFKNAAEEAGYNFTYEQIAAAFDKCYHNDLRDDLHDSPIHHDVLMRELRVGSRIVTDDQVLAGQTKPFSTVILVHDPESPFFAQHWINAGTLTEPKIFLWWNHPKLSTRWVSRQEFKDLYRKGFPNAGYEIGKQFSIRGLVWWKRAYYWITRKLF